MDAQATNPQSPRAGPVKKRQRSAEADADNEFTSRAQIKNLRPVTLRKDRKQPQRFAGSQLVDSDEMDIDEYDQEEKEMRKRIKLAKDAEINVNPMRDPASLPKLPAELLGHIAGYLEFLPDKISFLNTSKEIRTVLGPSNNFGWYSYGKDRNAPSPKFASYDPKLNYYKIVKQQIGIHGNSNFCSHCLSRTVTCAFPNSIGFKLCKQCVVSHVIRKLSRSLNVLFFFSKFLLA